MGVVYVPGSVQEKMEPAVYIALLTKLTTLPLALTMMANGSTTSNCQCSLNP